MVLEQPGHWGPDGAGLSFRNSQPGTFRVSGQQGEIVPLVAALHIYPKVVAGWHGTAGTDHPGGPGPFSAGETGPP